MIQRKQDGILRWDNFRDCNRLLDMILYSFFFLLRNFLEKTASRELKTKYKRQS